MCRLAGKRGDLFGVLPPQFAVDRKELLERISLGLDLGRALEDGRDDPIEEAIVERDPALLEWSREGAEVEIRTRRVACLVPGKEAHRGAQVLVVAQREERHADVGVSDVHAWHAELIRGIPGYSMSPTTTPDWMSAGWTR